MKKLAQENMHAQELDPFELSELIVRACGDAKGRDISVLNVSKVFSEAEYFVIVSGRSDRQVQGIGNKIVDTLAEVGVHPYSKEGFDQGHWILLDFSDVVVHIFYEPARELYDIESLWTRATKLTVAEESDGLHVRAA